MLLAYAERFALARRGLNALHQTQPTPIARIQRRKK
jgi:hypothetical protein